MAADAVYRLAADVGGTFTDVILLGADGAVTLQKILSTGPHYDRAVAEGAARLTEGLQHNGSALVAEVVHGTTVATNAVLEHRGALTALITTKGFRDVLELRRIRMPHMYDLFWDKPPPLVERRLRFELDERVQADGTVLRPVDETEVRALAERLERLGVEAVAVCLLHAHRFPTHEREVGAILRQALPGTFVSLSSDVLREQQEYERTATTVVNAYISPLMNTYLADISSGLATVGIEAPLMIMQSSGGVATASEIADRPVFALESGPAAGVIAALGMCERLGMPNAITLDMGGTTAKASLIEDGKVLYGREYEVGASLSSGSRLLRGNGELIRIPNIDIAEVGAGGGSIAWLDSAEVLHVGPGSAGAEPGPACYGRGGSDPTITDANVVLGYIPSGPLADGDLSVSVELATAAISRVGEPLGLSVEEAALGIHTIANATMMRALRAVSSERGRDPRDFALVAYGGSGPIHAAALAEALGVDVVVVPPLAGLFSTVGLLDARLGFHDVRFCLVDVRDPDLALLNSFEAEMRNVVHARVGARSGLEWLVSADMRYRGQMWDVEVEFPAHDEIDRPTLAAAIARFEDEHERLYGIRLEPGAPIELRALRVAAVGGHAESSAALRVDQPERRDVGAAERRAYFGLEHGSLVVPVHPRTSLSGGRMPGPLLVDEYDTTVVVPPGWAVELGDSDALLITRKEPKSSARRQKQDVEVADQITQQVLTNGLSTIADEMATTIFRTAHSTIVRDVMDFSAALCSPTGETIAQAVTIPLHLGSIPTAMRALLSTFGSSFAKDDIYIMNDPFGGGMHTPDIYLVKPAFSAEGLIGFAVALAHHADVGGRVPGTNACDNTDIFQEGLRLPWLRLYSKGKPMADLFTVIRSNVRVPSMTLGDLSAQVAACHVGERGLVDLADRYGHDGLLKLMAGLLDHTEQLARAAIERWPDGTASFVDYLDSDGIEVNEVAIRAEVSIRGSDITVDLSDSDKMVRGALNATHSFTEASVYQAVMAAIPSDLPYTAGAFRPITVITRPGTIANVVMPGASSMRGVTGFRIFDAVNGALAQLIPSRIPAAGEGGNSLMVFSGSDLNGEEFVFYELVVGAWGGRPTADGNDGLCNPCATVANIPVEVAESDFPVLIERYGLVADSGGPGRFRGGLAVERSWRMLVPVSLAVRSDRQIHAPYGLAGGKSGGRSRNLLTRNGDRTRRMPPMFTTTITSGDRYHHVTPGGGGWGDPLEHDPELLAVDVGNEKVSRRAARKEYGVVLNRDGTVNDVKTATLRTKLRAQRNGTSGSESGDHPVHRGERVVVAPTSQDPR